MHQSLSHRFLLRSNDPQLAGLATRFIGDFAPPVGEPYAERQQDATPVVYSLWSGAGRPRYALDRDDQRVASSESLEELMSALLWQISGDTVQHAEGYLLVHAGAVVSPGGDGVLILGEAGSGKTTLVAALVQEGFGYLSDEAAAIELATGLAHPWPRPLGFRDGSRSLARFAPLFDPDRGDAAAETHVGIDKIRPGAVASPAAVRHVIDHCYKPDTPTRLQPLSRAVGLVLMGSAAPRLRHEGERGLGVLAGVIRGAGAHVLVGGDLEQSVRAVCELVDA